MFALLKSYFHTAKPNVSELCLESPNVRDEQKVTSDFTSRRPGAPAPGLTFAELIPLYHAARIAQGCREMTLSRARNFTNRLAAQMGARPAEGLTREEYKALWSSHSADFCKRLTVLLRWAYGADLIGADVTAASP